MLQAGQIVRYSQALWKVDYVNECRARLIPLIKRHIENGDSKVLNFDGEGRGVNISPNSELEIVTNIDRAKDELELHNIERELARAKHDLEKSQKQESEKAASAEKRAAKHQPKPAAAIIPAAVGMPSEAPTGRGSGITWTLSANPLPEVKVDSLKAHVLTYISQHPGCSGKMVAAALAEHAAGPAVAACMDRFWKAGALVRSDKS